MGIATSPKEIVPETSERAAIAWPSLPLVESKRGATPWHDSIT